MRHTCPTRSREGEPMLSADSVRKIARLSGRLMFPGFADDSVTNPSVMRSAMTLDAHALIDLLTHQIMAAMCFSKGWCGSTLADIHAHALGIAEDFVTRLPDLRKILDTDIIATYKGDPAAESPYEVIASYPGFRATVCYRIAHLLVEAGVPILPRMISELAHSITGIDIHPAATIGHSFVIDHGTGVVIGATAIIGDRVNIYQGVTLGAKSFVRDQDDNPVKGLPRHPIICDDVIIYANATILGRVTIGRGAVIGGNVWVARDVAPGEKLIQAKADNFVSTGGDK
ncbi:MAG: serine acetyltransferase [Duncaniella sp.]|nr:serine acetyltransferase [Duncaniella sp.]